MYVCMHKCIYVLCDSMYICMYMWMYVCMYVCRNLNWPSCRITQGADSMSFNSSIVCMYVCMYIWVYVCMYLWVYVCMYVCVYVCTCWFLRALESRVYRLLHFPVSREYSPSIPYLNVCMYVCRYEDSVMYVCCYIAYIHTYIHTFSARGTLPARLVRVEVR